MMRIQKLYLCPDYAASFQVSLPEGSIVLSAIPEGGALYGHVLADFGRPMRTYDLIIARDWSDIPDDILNKFVYLYGFGRSDGTLFLFVDARLAPPTKAGFVAASAAVPLPGYVQGDI